MGKKSKADSAAKAAAKAFNKSQGKKVGTTPTTWTAQPRCYESHPALEINPELPLVYGGSCSHPAKEDADVYIGFDHSMSFSYRSFPWKVGDEFLYHIQDMSTPKDAPSFHKMIKWSAKQLEAGRIIHAGCIGGHGRTGMFLAALVYHITQRKDAIEFVRENYCKKVVETQEQVEFLVKLGMDTAKPAKDWSTGSLGLGGGAYYGYKGGDSYGGWYDKYPSWPKGGAPTTVTPQDGEDDIIPIECKGNIWGESLEEAAAMDIQVVDPEEADIFPREDEDE